MTAQSPGLGKPPDRAPSLRREHTVWYKVVDGLPTPSDKKKLLLRVHSPMMREGRQDDYATGYYYPEDGVTDDGGGFWLDLPYARAKGATVIAWQEIEPYA
jgi:hypothetical protein